MPVPSIPPPTPLGLQASFGFGDRTGLATPGHVAALKQAGGTIKPIFAQQSIREMTRTQRTPENVMADALRGTEQGGYTGQHGADADHLKVPEDVDRTAAAGFTFFTIDPSDDVDPMADDYPFPALQEKFAQVRDQVDWFDKYRGKQVMLPTGTEIDLNERAVMRAAVKYGRAINRAAALAQHIDAVNKKLGRDYEIELSVDETPQPTTLAEHWIIAEQVLSRGMKLVSLAPRYIGDSHHLRNQSVRVRLRIDRGLQGAGCLLQHRGEIRSGGGCVGGGRSRRNRHHDTCDKATPS